MPSWRCACEDCGRDHSSPADRCGGRWYCPRTLPACPGHGAGEEACVRGDGFDCGALYCYRKHRNAGEFCFPDQGPWYCGQTDPLCPGHAGSGPEHRHGTGALRLYGSLMRERRSSTGLARSVVRILRESALAQIEFELYGDTVSGRDFMDVACLVETGAVTVRRLGVGALGGSRAEYSQSVNVMEVELRSWSVAEKAAIVHEAVHAIADYRAGGLVDAVEHEAVAFVAGAWYYRTQSVSAPDGSRAQAADRVVEALYRRRAPEGEDLRTLLQEVRRTYSGEYTFNGVDGAVTCANPEPRRRRGR